MQSKGAKNTFALKPTSAFLPPAFLLKLELLSQKSSDYCTSCFLPEKLTYGKHN